MKRLFILLLALAVSSPAWADFNLWTGGDSGSYTDASKWTATTGSETGKWVKSGKIVFSDSSVNLNGSGNNQLTIDAATVSATTNFFIATSNDKLGGSLTVQNNGSYTVPGTIWIGKNTETGYLNVTSGATVNLVGGYLSDAPNATAIVSVDGGTIKSTGDLYFAHHGAAELYISNGGKWDAPGNLRLGGNNDSNVVRANAKVEIGSLTDESNSGSITAAKELWIASGSSANVNLYRGTIEAKTLNIGAYNYGTLIVDKGAVTVSETLTLGPSGTMKTRLDSKRTQNELIINDGGTVTVKSLQTSVDGNKKNYIEINAGGVLEVSTSAYHANNAAGKDEVVVNGGRYKLSEESTGILSFGHHGYTKLTISNGGVIEEKKIAFAANSSGYVDMKLTGEGSKLSVTDTTYSVNLYAGDYTITDGAKFSVPNKMYLNSSRGVTSLNISNKGEVHVANGFWASKSAANITNINVSSDGLLSICETVSESSYFADSAGGTLNCLVDGGTITSKSILRMGHHGTMNLTVSNGGKINASSILLGAGDGGSKGVGNLYLSGAGSLIKTSGEFRVGSNSEGHLYFLASATGMGKIEAGSFLRSTAATTTKIANTISLGVDHGVSGIINYPEAGYEIVSTTGAITNWAVDDLSIWTVDKSDKSVVAKLNTDYKLATDLILNSNQSIDLSSLPQQGYAQIQGMGGDGYLLNLTFSGLDTLEEAETFADWISESESGLTATALSETQIEISGFFPSETLLTWDLSTAPILGVQMAAASGQSVPEPATWALLILGAAGVCFMRKRSPEAPDSSRQ